MAGVMMHHPLACLSVDWVLSFDCTAIFCLAGAPLIQALVLLQVKFTFGEAGLQLHYPAIYTTCTQALPNGSYVFPGPSGNAWLSARLQPVE